MKRYKMPDGTIRLFADDKVPAGAIPLVKETPKPAPEPKPVEEKAVKEVKNKAVTTAKNKKGGAKK